VSTWIWLCALVTVILTALVLLGWFVVSRTQNKKMVKQLRVGERDEKEMVNSETGETAISGRLAEVLECGASMSLKWSILFPIAAVAV
jgi:uncharacterized protein YneF (UPF0154 family)